MIQALQIRVTRFIKSYFPDGDTEAIKTALREILLNTDEGRVYKRRILACYSRTKQAAIKIDFEIAVESILLEYQERTQLSLLDRGGDTA